MIEKIKKKIGFALRIFGYQVAMSIYTIMITLPLKAFTDSLLVKTLVVLFSIILFLVMIYFASHDIGAKDYIGRNNPINPPKKIDGLIYGIMSQLINYVLILLILIPIDTTKAIAGFILNFINYMYLPSNFIQGGINGVLLLAIWYLLTTLPQIIVISIAYIFGYKGIKILSFFKLDKKEIHSGPNDDNPNFDK